MDLSRRSRDDRRASDRDRNEGGNRGRNRGLSTTLDVALALLLLSAAVVVLAGISAPQPVTGDAADETAEVVAGSTATVNYSLSPGARAADESLVAFPVEEGPEFRRTAHGTLADLVAEAAVGDATVDGEEVTRADDGFERAVGNVTASALATTTADAQVRAVWRPYPGSPVAGRVAFGASPPRTATVHAATLTTPSGMPRARERAIGAADRRGYAGVAIVLANATVAGLFPPDAMGLALRGDYPVSALSRYRYRRAAALLGVTVEGPLAAGSPEAANRRLASALADRFERDLRERYPTPEAAARNASVGRVTITVRTWSA